MNTIIKIVSNRTVVKFQVSIPGANGANGQGVPVGGTAGQILNKINSTDYNTQWTAIETLFRAWIDTLPVLDDEDDATANSFHTTASNHKTLPGGLLVIT